MNTGTAQIAVIGFVLSDFWPVQQQIFVLCAKKILKEMNQAVSREDSQSHLGKLSI